MRTLWTLLVKDLLRARRNPWPFAINLAIPLLITGLIGLVFGGSSNGEGLGLIKLAIVDEDETFISEFLGNSFDQGEAKEFIDPSFVNREEGLELINDNEVSAMLVIPEGFMEQYLKGETTPPLELLKNPAQSFYPAITEELLRVIATALNAISNNLQSDFPEWLAIIEDEEGAPDMLAIAALIARVGTKFEKAEDYLFPPLITYAKETKSEEEDEEDAGFNLFAFLLPGLASMFLLFTADSAIRDLYKEVENKTFNRFRSINQNVMLFVTSKVIYALIILMIGGFIIFGGGGIIFQIDWENPFLIGVAVFAYALFAAGFMAFLASIAKTEKRADTINAAIIMGIAFAGGSFFPASELPAFVGTYISPLMPNFWFIETLRELQSGNGGTAWMPHVLKLIITGIVLVTISSVSLNRHFRKGGQA